ncbi:hypothetical protein LMIY3S_04521 [Labrys miyagiensis]
MRDGTLTIGFGIKEDISSLKDRDALTQKMNEINPGAKPRSNAIFGAQVNQFVNVAQTGDLVVCPMKTNSTIWIGRFKGPYRSGAAGEVTRQVEWLKTDVPRDSFRQDLLYSLGSVMTVCEISRNNAVERVQQLLRTGRDPGDGIGNGLNSKVASKSGVAIVDQPVDISADQGIDLGQAARDQIERRIASVFSGHDLTRLVAAILDVQGYRTRTTPPGADKGIDIVAGNGPLGLDSPRIVVQVKSGDIIVDQPTVQALIGSIQDAHADHGLIVSWGGFTAAVNRRLNELYFRVRLWGRAEIMNNLLATYDHLPEDIRAELPLKRTWTLVLEEDV